MGFGCITRLKSVGGEGVVQRAGGTKVDDRTVEVTRENSHEIDF